MGAKKDRLDIMVVEKGLTSSRDHARALIMSGKILVDNRPLDKPGAKVSGEEHISLKGGAIPYVGRGGLKLAGALQGLKIDVSGLVCLDVGASTGGFTDCLLQNGAKIVYAVDVGYGQLAWKLRQDPRVVVMERTNIRHLPARAIPLPVDLVTIDVSFISLKIVLPAILKFTGENARILALIKPQFEAVKGRVGKGGVVRDTDAHEQVLETMSDFFLQAGLEQEAVIPSSILGAKGNREFLVSLLVPQGLSEKF
ncbi:MAG: TlyA family RNA methyltransferase [Desulfobacterales bacterium]|nr:TlyA family RNA methyltransferase [Desulfobacterales bacterium]